jgi:3-oxoadipate enol-lactonase/4-carboxymuconolactone decarboxylase
MPFTTHQGARIHWRLQGAREATPIVLLHSIGTDLTIYDDVARLLQDRFLLARIDIRGHGDSDASEGDYSLGLLSGDVLAVLDALGIDRAIICGTSLGAMIAMELVQQAPGRVAGLILANTSPAMSPALWPERIATVRAHGVGPVLDGWAGRHLSPAWMAAHPAQVETLERGFAMIDPKGYIGNAAAIRDIDVLDGLPGVTAPTLIVAGEFDIATPFAGHGDRIAAAIPGATVETLPTGHLACLEQPEHFARCIEALAARCA